MTSFMMLLTSIAPIGTMTIFSNVIALGKNSQEHEIIIIIVINTKWIMNMIIIIRRSSRHNQVITSTMVIGLYQDVEFEYIVPVIVKGML